MTEQSYGPIPLTARLFSVLPLKILASTQKCEKRSPSQPMRIFPATEPKPGSPTHDFLIPARFVIWSGYRHDRRSVSWLEMIGPAGHTVPGRAERVGRHDGGLLRRPGLLVSHRPILGPPHRNGRRRHASRCDSRSQSYEAGGSQDLSSVADTTTIISEPNHSTIARPCSFNGR